MYSSTFAAAALKNTWRTSAPKHTAPTAVTAAHLSEEVILKVFFLAPILLREKKSDSLITLIDSVRINKIVRVGLLVCLFVLFD